ncbi:MAG: hypothetical protein NTY11_01525 [Candidatus Parcubacteria bacterium]|nr:hypothetical protein [Candidatus Parcubacteria bacterium]
MVVVIDLPKDRLNKIKLADWLEINALLDADHSSSTEDLTSLLKIEYSDKDDKIESLCTDVSSELLSRMRKIDDAYPFSFNGKLLKIKNTRSFKNQFTYLFCLFISYIGLDKGTKELKVWSSKDISNLFEKISTIVACNFLSCKEVNAQSLQFGAPRMEWKKEAQSFKKALEILKSLINEGNVKSNPTSSRRKDAGLDVIAWRQFPDGRTSKLFLLGQCATGNNFKQKRRDINDLRQYYSFWDMPGVIFSFFIPHEVDEFDWQAFYYPDVGILFDRSRIAFWAKEWDGGKFKSKIPGIIKKLKKYKKAL